jgi:ubiquinone/menaquinone biosynthesis C-methylase UbiE
VLTDRLLLSSQRLLEARQPSHHERATKTPDDPQPVGKDHLMSTPDEIKRMASGLFDRASATYDQTGNDFFGTFGRWVVEAAKLQPGERVLDVGSGRGAVLLPAARAVGAGGRVEGVDLAPGMVDRLRTSLDDLPQASVVLGDAEQPPVTGPYDAVLAGLVLFFLPDPLAALRNYWQLLRPGGRLAFSSFQSEDTRWKPVFAAAATLLTGPPPERPGLQQFSSDALVTDLVTEAGFTDVVQHNREHETPFAGKDDWWRWTWSHGGLAFWERLPAGRIDEARALAYQAIDDTFGSDADLVARTVIRVTSARRP